MKAQFARFRRARTRDSRARHAETQSRGHARRGVLLLVVLSLLALFALIGITFLLIAGQTRRQVKSAVKAEQYGDDPRTQIDSVFHLLVREPVSDDSPMRGHSLLADMYGIDGILGPIQSVTVTSTSQLIDIKTTSSLTDLARNPLTAAQTAQISAAGYFNGCVLTIADGNVAKDVSTRIVGWMFSASSATIRVMALPGVDSTQFSTDISNAFAAGTPFHFIINGRPFNGTGAGYGSMNGGLDNTTSFTVGAGPPVNVPAALLPNARAYPNLANLSIPPSTPFTPANVFRGGPDEDYDGIDAQNMFLAYVPLGATQPGSVTGPVNSDIIPSFHRPDLVAYMQNQYASVWNDPTQGPKLQRAVMFRPLQADHPNFNGSNPNFHPVYGPWDVDCDGDGIPDAVWIDVGMQVQTAPDGRRFKPLVAMLIVDMDGRLNLNAHGNLAQTDTNYSAQISPGPVATPTIANFLYNSSGVGVPVGLATMPLPRGCGYGPAGVNLGAAFGVPNLFTGAADYQNFFRGLASGSATYEGRYGEYSAAWTGMQGPGAGVTTAATGADDKLALIKRFDYPPTYNYYTATSGTNYATPPDLWDRTAVGVDYAGQPIWSSLNSTTPPLGAVGSALADMPNDPYALNLSRTRVRQANNSTPTTNDNAFSVGELEALLRRFDLDSSALPGRLRVLLQNAISAGSDVGRLATTDAYDLPSPSMIPTKDMATELQSAGLSNVNVHIVDMLRAKLIAGGVSSTTQQNTMIADLLPPELIAGVRMDLNRPFGNGVDDTSTPNGVVDEPQEYSVKNEASTVWQTQFGVSSIPFDLNNDGVQNSDDTFARQKYAKQLYTLMMLLVSEQNPIGQQYAWAQDSTGMTPAKQLEITARRIAQWAINVVDFRDPDAIMTPFEYDVNPFNDSSVAANGVDGILGSSDDSTSNDRRVVWGVEYPELLLTETLAFHDRRVKDTKLDPTSKDLNDMVTPDTTMDQIRVPQGSLFLELYCPRNGNSSIPLNYEGYPAELYFQSGGAGTQPQLNLSAMDNGGTGSNPVWRVAITQSTGTSTANDVLTQLRTNHPETLTLDPVAGGTVQTPATAYPGIGTSPIRSLFDNSNGAGAALQIERIVWFTSQDPSADPDVNQIFYNKSGPSKNLLSPGQFAVVGPRVDTYLGLMSDGTLPSQKIKLDTSAMPTGQVTYTQANATSVPTNSNTGTPFPALPIICVSSKPPVPPGWTTNVGLSITEPLFSAAYYKSATGTGPSGDPDTYPSPLDQPLDSPGSVPQKPLSKEPGLLKTGSTGAQQNYKTALLQRLANPLAAFDATINPYITVDWMPIDITVFNGQALQDPAAASKPDPDDNVKNPPSLSNIGSAERGGNSAPAFPDHWTASFKHSSITANRASTPATQTPTPVVAVFDYNIANSLGYFGPSISGSTWAGAPTNPPYYGYKNAPNPSGGRTVPWLTWNNRPYVSSAELMLVPDGSAEQMLRQFGANAQVSPAVKPYDSVNPSPQQNYATPFKHLMNFFMSANGDRQKAPYYYRLFDYVQVPSPFIGTDTYLNPSQVATALTNEVSMASFLHPPFNKVSNYRDPGRININTIPSLAGAATPNSPVWTAVMNNFPITGAPTPTWDKVVQSRRGYGASTTPVTTTDGAHSSVFGSPFRTAGGSRFALPGSATPPDVREVDATLMRRGLDPSSGSQTDFPLFDLQQIAGSLPMYMNPARNPYFYYQLQTRMNNLLTTRSNVFAVWITVGYFEVQPAPTPVDLTVYPDAMQLGRELGVDTGEVKRHRAFYIYDRSIPVGFEPGKNHNIDNGVLLKRYIE